MTRKQTLAAILRDAEESIHQDALRNGGVGYDNFERRMKRQEEEERVQKLAMIGDIRKALELS